MMTRAERIAVAARVAVSLAITIGIIVFMVSLARMATKKAALVAIDQLGPTLVATASQMPSGTRLELNGGWVEFDVGASDASIEAEVDRIADECEAGKAVKEAGADSGFVLCHEDIEGIIGLLSVDPTKLGLHSFAYVDRAEGKTRYVHLRADETLTLGQLVPESGDAPGFDVPTVPRIDGVQRWMSFRDEQSDYQAAFYGSGSSSHEQTLAWYRAELERDHWLVELSDADDEPYLLASRGASLVVVLASDGCEGTCLSVISSASGATLN